MIKKFKTFQFRLEDPMVLTLQEIELLSKASSMSHHFDSISLCLLHFGMKAVLFLHYAMIWERLKDMCNRMQETYALPHYAPDCRNE